MDGVPFSFCVSIFACFQANVSEVVTEESHPAWCIYIPHLSRPWRDLAKGLVTNLERGESEPQYVGKLETEEFPGIDQEGDTRFCYSVL